MKILLVHQFLIREDEPGGSRHISLLRFFAEQGHEVKAIAGSVNYMTGRSKFPFWRLWKKEKIGPVSLVWVQAWPLLRFGLFGKLLTYFSFAFFSLPFVLRENPDIVIATSPPPTVGLLGLWSSRIRKIPWIFEVRDLWPESGVLLKAIRPGKFYSLFQRTVDWLYRKASHIITLTWGLESEIVAGGIEPQNVTTIPNGVDPIFLESPASDSFPDIREMKKNGKFVVVYVGALGKANRVDRLVDLAIRLRDDARFQFIFAGDGGEKKSLVEKSSHLSNVHFLGAIPRRAVPSLLQCAAAGFVILENVPGFRHALSNKLFDYMASSLPIILALPEGDASRILEKAGGGFRVNPDDVDAMERQVRFLADHRDVGETMGKRGKEFVMQNFLRKELAAKYLTVLEGVLRCKPLK